MSHSSVVEAQPCTFSDWGMIDFETALCQQRAVVKEVQQSGVQQIIFCEHPAILTCGRATQRESLLASRHELNQKNIRVIDVDRGGDMTLHAPGQMVVYPILDLNRYGKSLHGYMEALEQIGINLAGFFGIKTTRLKGKTGVWVGNKKLVSIGIGCRKWITFHGMSINIQPDLNLFQLIRPCGMDVEMTSLQALSHQEYDVAQIKSKVIDCFQNHFQLQ